MPHETRRLAPRFEDPSTIIDEIMAGAVGGGNVRAVIDRREAMLEAVRSAKVGDILIVAGRGHEPCQLTKGEKIPFDDRRELAACFAMLA